MVRIDKTRNVWCSWRRLINKWTYIDYLRGAVGPNVVTDSAFKAPVGVKLKKKTRFEQYGLSVKLEIVKSVNDI